MEKLAGFCRGERLPVVGVDRRYTVNLEANAEVSWAPIQFMGELALGGEYSISVAGIGLGIAAEASLGGGLDPAQRGSSPERVVEGPFHHTLLGHRTELGQRGRNGRGGDAIDLDVIERRLRPGPAVQGVTVDLGHVPAGHGDLERRVTEPVEAVQPRRSPMGGHTTRAEGCGQERGPPGPWRSREPEHSRQVAFNQALADG